MKKVSLEGIAEALEHMDAEVELPEETRNDAHAPLKRMLELASE